MAEWWHWLLGVLGVGAVGGTVAYVAFRDPLGWKETGKYEWRSTKVKGYRIRLVGRMNNTNVYIADVQKIPGTGWTPVAQTTTLGAAKQACEDHYTGVEASSSGEYETTDREQSEYQAASRDDYTTGLEDEDRDGYVT